LIVGDAVLAKTDGSGIATHGENGAERETLLSVTVQIAMIVRHTVLSLARLYVCVLRVAVVLVSRGVVVSLGRKQ
jgi:hypothetical protein